LDNYDQTQTGAYTQSEHNVSAADFLPQTKIFVTSFTNYRHQLLFFTAYNRTFVPPLLSLIVIIAAVFLSVVCIVCRALVVNMFTQLQESFSIPMHCCIHVQNIPLCLGRLLASQQHYGCKEDKMSLVCPVGTCVNQLCAGITSARSYFCVGLCATMVLISTMFKTTKQVCC
jgi:hypothetical protein